MNGRISDWSYSSGTGRFRFFFTAVLDSFDALSMIRVQDGERIISMGANPVQVFVNGNCKFDQAAALADPRLQEEMKRLVGIGADDQVFVAGSTHEGEEEAVISKYSPPPGEFPETDPSSGSAACGPFRTDRKNPGSKGNSAMGPTQPVGRSRAERCPGRAMGYLRGALRSLQLGDSRLHPGAAWSPSEGKISWSQQAWGKVALYGPSMEDFLDAHRFLSGVGAGIMVRDEKELTERCLCLLTHSREREERERRVGNPF